MEGIAARGRFHAACALEESLSVGQRAAPLAPVPSMARRFQFCATGAMPFTVSR